MSFDTEFSKRLCFRKQEIVVENDPEETLNRIAHNLIGEGYNSSFIEAPPPFSTDDNSWCPPPELDWYEGVAVSYRSKCPEHASYILIRIEALRKQEDRWWDEYQDNLRNTTHL